MSFDVDEKQAPSLVATESQNQMVLISVLAAAALAAGGFWLRFAKTPPPEPPKIVEVAPPPAPVVQIKRYDPPPDAHSVGVSAPALDNTSAQEPEGPPATEWRMRGKIYNLVSLNPIPLCMIVFIHPETSARYETSTTNDGNYRTTVPALAKGGYATAFSHPDYHSSFRMSSLKETQEMSPAKRRQEAQRLIGIVNEPVALAADGKKPIHNEFFLIPRRMPKE